MTEIDAAQQDRPTAPPPTGTPGPHQAAAASHYRRSRGVWRAIAFIALALVVLIGLGRFVLSSSEAPGPRIARVEISGAIVTDPTRLAVLERLGEDEAVEAVLVAINSPGGTTAGGEELYEALRVLAEQKPVVAVINELGASAAYMVAIGTDRIFARRLSLVGSVGVLYQHVDAGGLFDTIGVDLDQVTSGALKAEPQFDQPLAGEVREAMQDLVDDSFDFFIDLVGERRALSAADLAAIADGRIVNGRRAEELGLIDAFGGEAEAIAWLEAEAGIGADLPVSRAWPLPENQFELITRLLGQEARMALGLSPSGPIMLDGLVSLWHGRAP